ncbi:hypothetical protein Tco_0935296 [Tanacetum coccineum]
MWNPNDSQIRQNSLYWGISPLGAKREDILFICDHKESARDVYSKRRIIAVTKVEIVEWHNYKHLDWITVRRDDDILYKFKEGDFQRLRIPRTLKNMFTEVMSSKACERSSIGVESIKRNSNLTNPDTYREIQSERRTLIQPYSDPRDSTMRTE